MDGDDRKHPSRQGCPSRGGIGRKPRRKSWIRRTETEYQALQVGSPGRGRASPIVIPAAESTLGSHPCVALSSAQVLPEWTTCHLAVHAFAANGDNPLNFFVSR
jgi:hypothetical protein